MAPLAYIRETGCRFSPCMIAMGVDHLRCSSCDKVHEVTAPPAKAGGFPGQALRRAVPRLEVLNEEY